MLKFFVDSNSDCTPEDLKKYDLGFLPFSVILNDKEYLSDISWNKLDRTRFYSALEIGSSNQPMQSRPSLETWKKSLEPYVSEGYDIVYLATSQKISGSLTSFSILKDIFLKEGILKEGQLFEGIDTQLVSLYLKTLIIEIIKNQVPFDKLESFILEIKPKISAYAISSSSFWLMNSARMSEVNTLKDYPLFQSGPDFVRVVKTFSSYKEALEGLLNLLPENIRAGYIGITSENKYNLDQVLEKFDYPVQVLGPSSTISMGLDVIELSWLV